MINKNQEVKSISNFWVNSLGAIIFFTSFFLMRSHFSLYDISYIIICLFAGMLPIMIYEIYRGYISKDNITLNFRHRNKFNFSRIAFKLMGMVITYGVIYYIYRLFPIYRDNYFFTFYNLLFKVLDYIFILSVPYFIITDLFMRKPEDSYYQLGRIITFKFSEIDSRIIWEHFKTWIVKLFFLPLMCMYSLGNFNFLYNFNFTNIATFQNVYDFLYTFIFTIDVVFAVIGYAMTLKLFNTQIQSAEPTMLGWVVCLMCYEPFWTKVFNDSFFAYEDNFFWGNYFSINGPGYIICGSMILLCLIMYSLSTVAFGLRFSNITYRGTVTNGPYALTKHPAYFFKNLSWWLISIPMLGNLPLLDSLRNCALLFGINIIYYLRARTEENHLSNYPEYVAYANMMNEKSIFAWISRILPFMKYDVERARRSGSKVYQKFVGRTDLVFENPEVTSVREHKEVSLKKAVFEKKKKNA